MKWTLVAFLITFPALAQNPDLIVTDFKCNPTAAPVSETFEVLFKVKNSGQAGAKMGNYKLTIPSSVGFLSAKANNGFACGLDSTSTVVTCRPSTDVLLGTSQWTGLSVSLKAAQTAGSMTFKAEADFEKTIVEANEANNTASISCQAFERPKLSIKGICPAAGTLGANVPLSITVKNVGSVTVRYEKVAVRVSGPKPFIINSLTPSLTPSPVNVSTTAAAFDWYPQVLAPGAAATMEIGLKTSSAQTLTVRAEVSVDNENTPDDNVFNCPIDVR